MIKRLFMAALLAVFLTAGWSMADTKTYPQMQTQEMIEYFKNSNCEIYGAYNDPATDTWIVWGKCVLSEGCESFMVVPPGYVYEFESCGQGYEGYLLLCKKPGSCI